MTTRYAVYNSGGQIVAQSNDMQQASDLACDLINAANQSAVVHDTAANRAFPWTVYKRELWMGFTGTQYRDLATAWAAVRLAAKLNKGA